MSEANSTVELKLDMSDLSNELGELIGEIEELRKERDELAAHVEAQNSVLEKASAMGFFTVCYDSGTDHKQLCRKVAALHEKTSTTILKKRDMNKQAEALEKLAKEFKEVWPEHNGKHAWILGAMEDLHQQAKEL